MRRHFGAFLAVTAGGLVACNSLLGINPPIDGDASSDGSGGSGQGGGGGDPGADECLLNSECDDLFVCLFRTCSPVCAVEELDKDCPAGFRCLETKDGTACVSASQAACVSPTECPEGTTCSTSSGQCRIACTFGDDVDTCPTKQHCGSLGACLPDLVEGGSPCSKEDAFTCAAAASTLRLHCEDGTWVEGEACEDGSLCDNAEPGHCAQVPADCQGRDPGESFCDGAARKTCGEDLVTVSSVTCDSIQHCTSASGAACALCLTNEYECSGDDLRKCNDSHDAFVSQRTCTDERCNEVAGDCSEFACGANQTKCFGDTLKTCLEDRSGFDEGLPCGAGLCDSDTECDECPANTARCGAAATARMVCATDGQSESEVACPAGHCAGADGAAVCTCPTAPSDCTGAGTVCRAGQLATCGNDSESCVVTTDSENCASPKVCAGSFPNAGCVCPTVTQCDAVGEKDGAYCSSGSRISCSASGGCQQVTTTACAVVGTEQCVGSHPNAKCEHVYGYGTTSSDLVTLPALYLNVIPITTTESMQLQRLGFLGTVSGGVIMAVYADSAGAPGALVARTAATTQVGTRHEYSLSSPVTPPTLGAGTYWVGLVAETNASLQRGTTATSRRLLDLTASVWAPPLPTPFTAGSVTSANPPRFYMVGVP